MNDSDNVHEEIFSSAYTDWYHNPSNCATPIKLSTKEKIECNHRFVFSPVGKLFDEPDSLFTTEEEIIEDLQDFSPFTTKEALASKKPNLSLFPATAVIAGAKAMQFGADKYGPYNWREEGKVTKSTTMVAAALRHLYAYLDGEDCARDSGISHIAHAIAGLAVLIDANASGKLTDDRPIEGMAADCIENN
jgi:hypothetical protein